MAEIQNFRRDTLTQESPWIPVEEVCESHYGVSYATAKNKIAYGTFEVPTYKMGKKHVIDRAVHEAYFRRQREAGLLALKTTTS